MSVAKVSITSWHFFLKDMIKRYSGRSSFLSNMCHIKNVAYKADDLLRK